jgi:hypothetical protein
MFGVPQVARQIMAIGESMSRIELRGDRVIDAPDLAGLYAWYYRPIRSTRDGIIATWGRLLTTRPTISTRVTQRYGVRYISEGLGNVVLGSDERKVAEAIREALDHAPHYFESLLESDQFVHFCRPIYIGIAKSLRERIYSQHYLSLIDYWDEEQRVGRFLKSHPDATVQFVMERLDIPHSFALEARVMGISPRDLTVSIFPTPRIPATIGSDVDADSESTTRRALERLLQLLTEPVCGRR